MTNGTFLWSTVYKANMIESMGGSQCGVVCVAKLLFQSNKEIVSFNKADSQKSRD